MNRACFRFYAELNDFLPPGRRGVTFTHSFEGSPSIKDVIEALGVPHTEVDLILVNGESVDFAYWVREGDRVSVYPVFESLDITSLARVRPRPLRETRFVLDTHLGRLAAYLRLLGFDTLYRNDARDDELARISSSEGPRGPAPVADRCAVKALLPRLLTRDRGLLKRSQAGGAGGASWGPVPGHGYCVRETGPRRQLAEVVRRFDLSRSIAPFQRCMRCNGVLQPVDKEEVSDRLPPLTRQYYDEFHICPACDRVYWKGSHYRQMRQLIDQAGFASS